MMDWVSEKAANVQRRSLFKKFQEGLAPWKQNSKIPSHKTFGQYC